MKNKAPENGNDSNKIFEEEDKEIKTIIAADKDGTINMTKDGNLLETLQYLKQKKALFVLISGRTGADAVDSFQKIGITKENGLLPKYIFCDNGAGILNTKKEEIVYKKTIEREKLDKIIELYQQEVGTEEGIRITNGENIMVEKTNERAMRYYENKGGILKPISHIAKNAREKIKDATKVTLSMGNMTRQQVETFKGKIEDFGCYVDIGESNFLVDPEDKDEKGKIRKRYILDIMDKAASKGNVLNMLIEYIRPERVMVYGNSYNDISMYDEIALNPHVSHKAICLVTNPFNERDTIDTTKHIYRHLKEVQKEVKQINHEIQTGKRKGPIIPEATPFLIPPSPNLGNALLKQCMNFKLTQRKNPIQEGHMILRKTPEDKEER